jgi:hypothetical protein
MIYTSPINAITWQSVEDFLGQGVKEGSYLDYKLDWPANLERTIAAMANTLGGVILIGVDENADGSPKLPAVGIPLTSGLAERVTNIVLSNITPPVFPEVAVCPDGKHERALVVIRVPQSHQTPHAIMASTRVYLRTANRNNPEDLATLDQIEWLRDHRARAMQLRTEVFGAAVARSDLSLGLGSRNMNGAFQRGAHVTPYLTLFAAPFYPRDPFARPPELRSLLREICVRDYYRTGDEFPLIQGQGLLLQDGVYAEARMENEYGLRTYYTELGTSGHIFYRQLLSYKYRDKSHLIRASELFTRLDEFLRVAKNFFDKLGYQGSVYFAAELGDLAASTLGQWHPSETIESFSTCPDSAIAFETTLSVASWRDEFEAVVIHAAQKFAWGFNWDLPAQLVKQYLAKHQRSRG